MRNLEKVQFMNWTAPLLDRHSRAGGNPGVGTARGETPYTPVKLHLGRTSVNRRDWIPACAGMTAGLGKYEITQTKQPLQLSRAGMARSGAVSNEATALIVRRAETLVFDNHDHFIDSGNRVMPGLAQAQGQQRC